MMDFENQHLSIIEQYESSALDIFIRYRNGIAHGGDISSEEKVTQDVYSKYRKLVNDLMYAMHDKFMEGIQRQTYLKERCE